MGRRQARIVAEDAQRPAPVPRLAELLLDRLQRRRNLPVFGVTIGNERVVCCHAAESSDGKLRGA